MARPTKSVRKRRGGQSQAPTIESLAARVDDLARRIDALAAPASALAGLTARSDDLGLADQLAARRGVPYEKGDHRGAVAYGGALELGERQYLWQVERPLPGLLALDPAGPAAVLAALAHPHRLRLLMALIERPRTAAELQHVIGSRSPGPLYHHLRDLTALGVVVQRERNYQIPARHVVPLLTALALAVDLAASQAGQP